MTSVSPSPYSSPVPPSAPMPALHTLRSTCLSLLLSQQSHPIGFPSFSAPPIPLLPPSSELSTEEKQLLVLWGELRDVVYERMMLEARADLAREGKLEDERDYEEDTEEDEELDERIRKLETEVTRLRLEEATKEEVTLAAVVSREVSNTVYGVKSDAGAASIVKTRALRSLLHHRTRASALSAGLHTQLTNLHTNLTTSTLSHSSQISENRALAQRILKLTTQLSARNRKENIRDQDLRDKITEMERQVHDAKTRWEVARNVFQGVVAASGVDWVRVEDGRLKGLMLEAGEELE
ncbi:hypothetical protein BDZ91DRAFT_709211 [Kalaharituber pfeilii]|nr:hypothetical protein BDZ91DRAFT_709211 [Kalaharituber pfeilii]